MKKPAIVCLLLILVLAAMQAQEHPGLADLAARGRYLTVKIAVAGPGDELYFWWGHIGIIIEDALSGQSRFYDWGVFSFDTENFYLDFAYGRPYYSCAAVPAGYNIAQYINTNRDLTLYTLDLPPEVKTELLLFAENNILPENRNYMYHHFRDNCATRVRDIIDQAVGGAFKARYGEAPGRFTLRQHVRRHTWFSFFWDWALSFWMGRSIDQSITVWDEMFLPSEIAAHAVEFMYTDAAGQERKLVSDVEVLSQAEGRPGTAELPPQDWFRELILGLCIAAVMGFLLIRTNGISFSGERKISRRVLGTAHSVLGLFFGIMGTLLFFLTAITNHDYTFGNINIVFINPLILAAVPLGLIAAFSRKPEKCKKAVLVLQLLWSYVFLAGVLTIVLRLFPGFYQENQPALALVLPIAFVLSGIPFRLFVKTPIT